MASNVSAAVGDRKPGLGLGQVELRALEQTRLRLQNLTHSLASFKHDLQMNNPLPNPQSLQASAVILKNHTNYLLDHLTKQTALFQRLAVHPSTNYPGRTQEAVQTQLLRKKLDPQIETLVEAARAEAEAAGISPDRSFVSHERLLAEQARLKIARRQAKFGFGAVADDESSDDDDGERSGSGSDGGVGGGGYDGGERVNEPIGLGDVWVDCVAWSKHRLARFAKEEGESLYTAEEREMGVENVRTGLKRSLEESESESEEEEEEDEEEEEEEDEEEDGEGDTAMGGVARVAALKAGGLGATGRDALAQRPEEDVKEWMAAMAAFGARGEEVSAPMVGVASSVGLMAQR
ncbi:unnamed protein product [Discula destructiva]